MNTSKITVLAASLLALAATASAQVTLSGFALGSYQHVSGAATDRLDIDSAMLKASGETGQVKGVLSLYYVPGSAFATDSDIHVLDAYATYAVDSNLSITGGRFLSWMGYESFFAVNNTTITTGYLNPVIAGYEEGVRLSYTEKDWNAGLALVDSALTTGTAFHGDNEIKKGYGAEAYLQYNGITSNKLWVGLSYDSTNGGVSHQSTFDIWDEYQIDKSTFVAAEIALHDGGVGTVVGDSTSWLVLLNYMFDEKISASFRVGGDQNHGPVADDVKYTFAPTYMINKNFSVRGEISYIAVTGPATPNPTFIGVQGVFKF